MGVPTSIVASFSGTKVVLNSVYPLNKFICESPLHEMTTFVKTAVHAETIVPPDNSAGSIINVSFMSE